MIRPVRLRVSRAKGAGIQSLSRAVNGLPAVVVTRSGRFGNPFPVGQPGPLDRIAPDNKGAVGFFITMLDDPDLRAAAGYPDDLTPLAGKNLACACPAHLPCHAEVLIAAANRGTTMYERADLLPCLRCEGEALVIPIHVGDVTRFTIRCQACRNGLSRPRETENEAIDAWNGGSEHRLTVERLGAKARPKKGDVF